MRYEPNPKYLPPKANEPPLHRAARVGDHEAIRALVQQGVDVNAVFNLQLDPDLRPMRATPVCVAAGSGDGATPETVRLLLECGADPTVNSGDGTAARFAVGGLGWNYRPGGDAARLRLMLAHGIDPNETDRRGVSLLAEAAATGDGDRVRALLEHGANPNWMRESEEVRPGWSRKSSLQIPLFCAAEDGDAQMMLDLIRAGASVTETDGSLRTALFLANTVEKLKVLLDAGLDLRACEHLGWTPLWEAVSDADVARVKALLTVGADLNVTHDHGFTLFMHAVGAFQRTSEMIQFLLSLGVDPHAVTEYRWNAFHAAIDVDGAASTEESITTTLGLLAGLGVDINHCNKRGETPLAMARRCGREIEVRTLLALGAEE